MKTFDHERVYKVQTTTLADADIYKLAKSEPAAYRKLKKLLAELALHPTTGTGKPHALVGDKRGLWSRSITHKHRLVYEIHDDRIIVIVVAACGHYDDK